jgi:hypothetical protein
LVSGLAALGRYGSPLWLARCLPTIASAVGEHDPPFGSVFRVDGNPLDGDGGFYWLMATLLPGFGTFRFPSKLLTFLALAVSGLAALGWDRLTDCAARRTMVVWGGLLAFTLAVWCVAALFRQALVGLLTARGVIPSAGGPLDAQGAVEELLWSLGHASAVFLAAGAVIALGRRRSNWAGPAALLLVTADLAAANARLVWTIPQREFDRVPEALRQIEAAERTQPTRGPFRVHRMPQWYPFAWLHRRSPARLSEIVAWERDTLQPLFALPEHVSYTMTKGALELYDYLWFFRPRPVPVGDPNRAERLGLSSPVSPVLYFPRRGFDLWTTRYYIVPVRAEGWMDENRAYASFLEDAEIVYPNLKQFEGPGGARRMEAWREEQDFQILRSKTAYPRAWVVHAGHFLTPIQGMTEADRNRPMRLLLFQNDSYWHDAALPVFDTRNAALVETEDRRSLAPFLSGEAPGGPEPVEVTHYGPKRVELTAHLRRPGLVVLADVYYPGWRLTIDGSPAPIVRANRMMRGAAVNAGTHRLVYTYDPPSFRYGLIAALGGLIALGFLLPWAARAGRNDTKDKEDEEDTKKFGLQGPGSGL